MKTGKKTGRWKYAVPVLILVLILALLGLLWNNVNNTSNSTDEIYLYGEWHSDSHILDRELEIWGEYYKKGMRDLFVEYPYTDAQFLNLWMQADDDELLDQQFKDWEGTAGGTEIVKNFLKQIKKTYPKTVFHGTDVGHTWHSTGPQYLKYLKSTGQMDTEEYQRALLNIQQGKRYARICQTMAMIPRRELSYEAIYSRWFVHVSVMLSFWSIEICMLRAWGRVPCGMCWFERSPILPFGRNTFVLTL